MWSHRLPGGLSASRGAVDKRNWPIAKTKHVLDCLRGPLRGVAVAVRVDGVGHRLISARNSEQLIDRGVHALRISADEPGRAGGDCFRASLATALATSRIRGPQDSRRCAVTSSIGASVESIASSTGSP